MTHLNQPQTAPEGGWRRAGRGPRGEDPGEGGREPVFRAASPAVALAAGLLALYALQSLAGVAAAADAFGLVPAQAAHARRLWTLLTSQFVHLGWAHVGLNALSVVAFGAGVSRALGAGVRGVAAFLGFYLACGVLAGLTEVALHPHGVFLVVGASGAASGLVGAISRLVPGQPGLLPLRDRQVVAMALAWVAANGVLGLTGMDLLAGGAPIAWGAHLGGYAAGALGFGGALSLSRGARRA